MARDAGSDLRPLRLDRHRDWCWQPPEGYAFARSLRLVPITLHDAVFAAACFPLVFSPDAAGPVLQVLLRRAATGLSPFIGRDGRWQASWLPPRLATWPFDLIAVPGGGHALALCEGAASASDVPGAVRIFREGDAEPALSPEAARIAAELKAQAEHLPATLRAAAALQRFGLLTSLDTDPALRIVDEAAAAALDEDAVLALHRDGALALLHAGLVSRAHLPWMARAERHLSSAPPLTPVIRQPEPPPGSSFLSALATAHATDAGVLQLPDPTYP